MVHKFKFGGLKTSMASDGIKKVLDFESNRVELRVMTPREIAHRLTVRQNEAIRRADEAQREQQRQVDLNALETATADDIGRIIARLLRA